MADILSQIPDLPPGSGPDAHRIAETLQAVLSQAREGELTVGALLDRFRERAFGLLLILLNLPNIVFAPPVLAGVAAVPTAFFGGQLLLGRSRPWLPAALLRRPVSATALQRVLGAAGGWLDRLEALGRPRLAWAAGPWALRLLGVFAVIAALIVLVPVPGTNVLPALSLTVMAVGVMRRDGVLVLAGALLGLAGLLAALVAAGLAVELVRWIWGLLAP